jgi:hypothetical protein
MAADIIERARLYIAKMPEAVAGQNGHDATYQVAVALVMGFDLSPAEALPLLEEYNARCRPPWSAADLARKANQADRASRVKRGYLLGAWTPPRQRQEGMAASCGSGEALPPVKPKMNLDALRRFAGKWADVVDLVWLANRSAFDPARVTSERFLELLYRPQEKVLVFDDDKSQGRLWPDEGRTVPHSGKYGVWMQVQPVNGEYYEWGVDKEGKPKFSRRSEPSITAWRYFVLESDEAPMRMWLGALALLPLRIAALYSSGGDSVHALVRVDAASKSDWDSIKAEMKAGLVTIGADPGAMSAVRLSRLPQAWREGKRDKDGRYHRFPTPRLQKLLYVNPTPQAAPLVDLLARRDVEKTWATAASFPQGDGSDITDVESFLGCQYYAPVSQICRQTVEWRLSADATGFDTGADSQTGA